MRHRKIKRILLSAGMSACLLLSCLAGSSIKPDAEGTGDTRKEYEDEKNTAKAYERTAELLSDQIRDINRKIAETTLEIEDLNGEINVLDLEIEDAEKLYFEYADGMIVEKEKINKVVKLLYENSVSEDEIATILQSEDISMVLNREEYLNGISNYYNEAVSEYNDMLVEAQEKESELNNLRLDREAEIIELEKKQQEMSADIKELGEVMAEAKKKSEDAQELANALAKKVAEIEAQERAALSSRKYDGSMSKVDYSGDGTSYYYEEPYPYTSDELLLMAGIIEAEAGSVSYPGMVAVGSVVMNRVKSPDFGNTIAGVVYAPYQFEPAETGRLAMILAEGPVDSCMSVAKEVLEGKRNVPNLYFKAAWYAEENGISGVNIGGNVFH
ncbi:Cell wall hydrolase CwlJ, involved in spore germination [Lachnospiraceae bacterium]|nr:Cell wall hydrolase CwlJ, involved in spore germination [Lachnospiraceae bacterium]